MDIEKLSKKHPTIHHYTSKKGLLGILNDECLWTTKFDYLNDSTELRYADYFIKKYLLDRFEKCPLNINTEAINKQYDRLLPMIFGDQLYIGSFSSHHNHANFPGYALKNGLLSMWRGYGGNSSFAIVLKTQELFNRLYEQAEKGKGILVNFDEVLYTTKDDREDAFKYFNSQLNDVFKVLHHWVTYNDGKRKENKDPASWIEKNVPKFPESFIELICGFKHNAFHEEQEVRIVVINKIPCHINKKTKYHEPSWPVEFRIDRASQLIPYIKIPLSNQFIEKIIVGPGGNQKNDVKCLEEMREEKLSLNHIEITDSETPFV